LPKLRHRSDTGNVAGRVALRSKPKPQQDKA